MDPHCILKNDEAFFVETHRGDIENDDEKMAEDAKN